MCRPSWTLSLVRWPVTLKRKRSGTSRCRDFAISGFGTKFIHYPRARRLALGLVSTKRARESSSVQVLDNLVARIHDAVVLLSGRFVYHPGSAATFGHASLAIGSGYSPA